MTTKLAQTINSQEFTAVSIIVETIHTEIANLEERISFVNAAIANTQQKLKEVAICPVYSFDAESLQTYGASMKRNEEERNRLASQIMILKHVLATATARVAAANA